MSKDPAFLFYTGDFSTGTQFFSDEQVGKFLRLLMAQHQHGKLTENQMIFICKTHDSDVFSKFIKDENGLFFNERLENEILRRKSYSESRSKNRTKKYNDIKNISKTYDLHMENKNKDIIIDNNIVIDNVYNSENSKKNNLTKNDLIYNELIISESWLESTAMQSKSKFTPTEILNYIKQYNDMINVQFDYKINRTEYCKHFVNWLNKQTKNNETTNTTAEIRRLRPNI